MAASLPNDPATAHVPIASLVRSEDTQALSDHLATMGEKKGESKVEDKDPKGYNSQNKITK